MTPETGLTADFAVSLKASIDGLTAAIEKDNRARQRHAAVIRQVPFAGAINITAGVGVYDQPDQLQAKRGYYWDVRRLTMTGWSAGAVTVYRNGAMITATGLNAGEVLVPFAVPATNTFTKASMLLMPGDRLCFGATGITAASGQISFWGVATCLEEWYLPYYLG
jgi:hypothetical protein